MKKAGTNFKNGGPTTTKRPVISLGAKPKGGKPPRRKVA